MTEDTFKSELLKQNGKSAVDEEVSRLHGIIAAEQRRVRRLAYSTVAVWVVWILMISLSLVVPIVAYHAAGGGPQPHATTMAVAPLPEQPAAGGAHRAMALVIGVLMVGAFLGLPIAGVVLALMLILTRRTASMNQVRASLRAIDAQLRALREAGSKPPHAE